MTEMEEKANILLLYNSQICRLCGDENPNGSLLYETDNLNTDISSLINYYLPLKISNDGKYPRWICPGCHLQVESTMEFFELVTAGQKKLKELLQNELSSWTETNDIVFVEEFHGVDQQNNESGLYSSNNKLFKEINTPKKKRGRPPKPPIEVQLAKQIAAEAEANRILEEKKQEELRQKQEEEYDGRRKRNIKIPTRFQEAVQGKELERIYIEKGVIDKSDALSDYEFKDTEVVDCSDDLIGHLKDNNGKNIAELVLNNSGRGYFKKTKTKFICDVCSRSFTQEFRFLAHRDTHYNVRYECTECELQFEARTQLSKHQTQSGHKGEGIIENLEEPDIKQFTIIKEECEPDNLIPMKGDIDTDAEFIDASISGEQSNIEEAAKVLYGLQNLDKTDGSHPALIAGDVEMGRRFDIPSNIDPKANLFILSNDDSSITALSSPTSSTLNSINSEIKKLQRFDCDICNRSFPHSNLLDTHFQLVHGPNAEEKSIKLLDTEHTELDVDDMKYGCDQCERQFRTASSLLYHKESDHNQGRRFACSKCNKTFKHKQLLQRHHLVHSNDRPYPCDICGASFKTKPNLLNHQSTHSGIKKYECTICKQQFAHKTSLKLHYRWHSGTKPFSCKVCSKTFTQNGNLQEHMRVHTGERPYECLFCDKKFKTSSQRRIHNKRHQKIRPYQCNICQKSFLHVEIYRTHMRRHNNHKPFSCSYCEKAFSEQWALRKHIRVHTGEKPYQCPVCSKAFSDCSNLAKHRKIHHTPLTKTVTGLKSIENSNTSDNVLLALNENDELSQQSSDKQVVYVTYRCSNINDESKILDSTNSMTTQAQQYSDVLLSHHSPNTNICLSDASILNEPISSATDYIDTTPVEVYPDHLVVNYIDNKQLPTANMQLPPEELQIENNSAIDNSFDKYGQTIELITTDGRKLRLLTPYPDQQLDLSELIIS